MVLSAMAIETEIKLRLSDGFLPEKLYTDPQILSYLKAPFRPTQMRSVYYDTADGEAVRRHWALRLRQEDGVSVATMKTAGTRSQDGGLFSRDEWQTEAPTFEAAVPALLKLGAPAELQEVLSRSPLEERCQIRFVRHSAVLSLPDGVRVDCCIDQGEIQAGGKSEPISELELELLFGPLEPLMALSTYLINTYGLQNEYVSKYERALRLIRSRK